MAGVGGASTVGEHMEPEETLQRLVHTLRRRAGWVRLRTLLLQAFFIGLCLCLGVAIWHRFVPLTAGQLLELWIGAMALCAIVALALGLRSRVDPLGLLIRADQTLKLRERLSTAHELSTSRHPHPLRSIVLQEAARVGRSVNPFRVIPSATPRTLRWTPFLLLAIVLALVVDFGVLLPPSFVGGDERPSATLFEQGRQLEREGKRLEAEARRRGLERSMEASRRMQSLGQRLQNEKINEREAMARVNSLSEYVRNLEEELKKMAVLEDVSLSKVREVMVNQASVSNEVQRLLGILGRGKLSPSEMRNLQERLQSLGQQGSLDERLSEALNQLRDGDHEGARDMLENYLLQDQMAQDFEHLQRAERALDRNFEHGSDPSEEMGPDASSRESGEDGEYEMAGAPRGGSAEFPGDFDEGDYLESEGMGSNSSIGSGRGTEHDTTRNRLTEAKSPASRIPGQTGEGGVRRSYVRALPLKADATTPLEDVITTYQKRAEESLLREEIPPNNRDLVRAYFLAIGLVEEAAGSEGKDEQRER
jgi:hypothetical protein